tara:strand:+ start:89 stop:973 length:885 start_codon:yes stop_codon:yes gene_type:complete
MKTIRIAGAQIPVTKDIQYNKNQIFKALDWARENEVDLLVTPEGSLSGYSTPWWNRLDELNDALKEVEEYQKKLKISLHLGTCFQDTEDIGLVNRNQIRHYSKNGNLESVTNKQYTVAADSNILEHNGTANVFQSSVEGWIVAGMICNDMWGFIDSKFAGLVSLNEQLSQIDPNLIIHSTNGGKMGNDELLNFSTQEQLKLDGINDTFYFWHEAWLRMTAVKAGAILVTADSCVSWNFDPNIESLNNHTTSSPSGIIDGYGNWLERAPKTGLHYFYYDVEINAKQNTKTMRDYR